jgi:microcystin-dependent protein
MKNTLFIALLFVSMSFTGYAQEAMIGEVKLFAGNFTPRDWAFCDGQLLPISNNSALFSLLGTLYGGDGRTTFALPDLRGRVPVSPGTGNGLQPVQVGERNNGTKVQGNSLGESSTQPTLGMHYIICLRGTYPSRS